MFEKVEPGAEETDLYAIGPDGGEPTLVSSPGNYPHWSADGRQLAFQACLDPPECANGVALYDRSTGDIHGFPMPDPDLFTACAVWAPSGKELACEGLSDDDPTRNGVYTVRASDGKGLKRITENQGGGNDIPLAYSPDGSQLLIDRADPSGGGSGRALFVAPLSGGQPERITPWGLTDDVASWSSDGRTIVFGTGGALYRVNPDGQGLTSISLQMPDGASGATAFDVAFSPDGERIVFSLASPPGIYTANLDGSDVKQLTTSPMDAHHANWGPALD